MATKDIWETCEIMAKVTGLKKELIYKHQTKLKEHKAFGVTISKAKILKVLYGLGVYNESSNKPVKDIKLADYPVGYTEEDRTQDTNATISMKTGLKYEDIVAHKRLLVTNGVYKEDLNSTEVRLVMALVQQTRSTKDFMGAARWLVRTVGSCDAAMKLIEAIKIQEEADLRIAELMEA